MANQEIWYLFSAKNPDIVQSRPNRRISPFSVYDLHLLLPADAGDGDCAGRDGGDVDAGGSQLR